MANVRKLKILISIGLIAIFLGISTILDTPKAMAAGEKAVPAQVRSSMSPDIKRILERGKLVVAILGKDNPPFFTSAGSDRLEGLDVKIASEIAKQLGVAVEFDRTAKTFNEVVDRVYRLDADIAISKLSRTLSRAKLVRFSSPYLKMRQGLLVNRLQLAQQTRGRSVTETIRDLRGEVGVIKGSSYVNFLKQKFPQAEIVEMSSWSEIVEAVTKGKILAGYRDELEIKKVVFNQPNIALNLKTIALTDTQDFIAMALPWDSQQLLAFVNQYLETIPSKYTADTILKEYSEYTSAKN